MSVIVQIPHWRSAKDLSIPQDLVEEIARIYGYDNIESKSTTRNIENPKHHPLVKLQQIIEDILVRDCKMDQVETYPRVDENILDAFGVSKESLLSLKNPFSPETKYLKNSMMYNLLELTKKNHKFLSDFCVFDIAKVRRQKWNAGNTQMSVELENIWDLPKCEFYPTNVVENYKLGMVWYAKECKTRDDDMFAKIKSDINFIAKKLWISVSYVLDDRTYAHPNKQAYIFADMNWQKIKIWQILQVHPTVLAKIKIESSSQTVFAELDLDILDYVMSGSKVQKVRPYFSFQDQIIQRDLCFVIDQNTDFEPILSSIQQIPEIIDVEIFDLYKGKNLPENTKSISVTITILWDWNFDTAKINEIMDKAIHNVSKVGWKLR